MSDITIEHIRALDGRLLLVLRELLRTHNASVAAANLGLTQSAVSHALMRLRRLHDDPLFLRRPHGLEPTRRALELGPQVEELIDLAGALHQPPQPFDPAASRRRFTVAAPEFVVTSVGGALLERWSTDAPGVSLVTRQFEHADVIDRLRRGDLDLGIGQFGACSVAGLVREQLYEDTYCVVVSRDHPTIGTSIDLRGYLAARHVVVITRSEGREGETLPPNLHVAASVPAWLTALSIVAASDAIATCPRQLALRHADMFGLRLLRLPGRRMPITVAVLRRAVPDDAGTAWLLGQLRRVITKRTHAR